MTRRSKWLNLVMTFGVLSSLLVVGLTSAQAKTANAGTGACAKQKKNSPKGSIRYSNWQFPDQLNTYQWGGLTTSANTLNFIQEGYDSFDQNARRVPIGILKEIPTVKNGGIKDNGKTWVFHLKPGLKWWDGQEITAADIKFGWRVDSDPVTGPSCLGRCDVISRIDTSGKYTVVIRLKKSLADFLDNLPNFWPLKWANAWSNGNVHQAAVKLAQDTAFNCEKAGECPTNGPYQVSQWVNGDRIVLSPNKNYNIETCGAKISQLIFAFYSDKVAMIAAAAAHQTDTTTNYTFADLPTLRKNPGAYKLINKAAFSFEHLEINVDKEFNGQPNPFANAKVRQAFALAIDKFGIVKSALNIGRSEASKGVIAWDPLVNTPTLVQPFADKKITGQYDPLTKKYTSDTGTGNALADAKKLLSQTPYKNGFTAQFYTTAGNAVRQAQFAVIQANVARIGIKLIPNYVTAGKLFGSWSENGVIVHGSFQVVMFAYGIAPDPDAILRFAFESKYVERAKATHPCPPCSNNAGVKDKTMDKYLETAAYNVNPKVRQSNYSAAQRRLNQQAWWIPLFYRPEIDTTDGRISNFNPSPTSAGPYWNGMQFAAKA